MNRDVVSGILLITGSLAGTLVMVMHPTAHSLLNAETFPWYAHLNTTVHGLALAAVPILFLGLLGLSRSLGWPDLATAALVVYGFGSIGLISAAVASGFVGTEVIGQLIDAEAASRDLYHALLDYTHMLNQSFARVHVVASSAAILLWSTAILKTRRMPMATGVAGAVVGSLVLLVSLSGNLRLNVHGFGIVVVAQSVWMIWLGVLLCRRAGGEPAPGAVSQ